MDKPVFYVIHQGKPAGPFSLQELQDMALSASDFVKIEGDADFRELHEHPQVSALLALPYEPTRPQYFASMDTRLLAWALDSLLIFSGYCIFLAIPVLVFAADEMRLPYLLIGLFFIPLVQISMGIYYEQTLKKGTPGKQLLAIQVTDAFGRKISFSQSLLRNVIKIVGFASLGIFFFIGFFDRRQQCLHDKIAGTLVIKDRLV